MNKYLNYIFLTFLMLLFIASCYDESRSDLYGRIENQENYIDELRQDIDNLKDKLNDCNRVKTEEENSKLGQYVSAIEAEKQFLRHKSFYCEDIDYKNLRLRNVDLGVYDIRYDCFNNDPLVIPGFKAPPNEWEKGMDRITFTRDDKYVIKSLSSGCFCIR